MSTYHLDALFRPKSIAVIGATNRNNSVGFRVMRNLQQGGFAGPIMPVNCNHSSVAGVLAYPDIEALPIVPDLGMLCIPARSVPEEIEALAVKGCRAVIVFDGYDTGTTDIEDVINLRKKIPELTKKHGIRILGPSSFGVAVPSWNLFASSLQAAPAPGRVAFISQSSSICSSVLDWARGKGVGFSHFISLGHGEDIDFGDLLDYLSTDHETRAILLYIENIHERRNFMSAARAAARNKLILAIRTGDDPHIDPNDRTHTGTIATSNSVYDAAFRRASVLRVHELEEMFSTVESLANIRPTKGISLAVLSNGSGIAGIANRDLELKHGKLAELSQETIEKLDTALKRRWSHKNPVDIMLDATAEYYSKAIDILIAAGEVSNLLVIHTPSPYTSPIEIAQEIIGLNRRHRQKNIITCFMGEERAGPARKLLREAGIPCHETPSMAIRSFAHLLQYRRNQEMLMETPAVATPPPDAAIKAKHIVEAAIAVGKTFLDEASSRALLAAYGIPFVESSFAKNPVEAGRIAAKFGGAVVLKIVLPDISDRTDLGGVALNLQGAFEVEKAGNRMIESVAVRAPKVKIKGFTVQRMMQRKFAHELIIGTTNDPIFGPAILFGHGGTAVNVISDFSIGLPPLNNNLAKDLIYNTRVAKLLQGYSDHPKANIDAICSTLVMISQLIVDIPEISSLDINPLIADAEGVIAVDCRICIRRTEDSATRLAIRPYPHQLEETTILRNGTCVKIRPIRPEDEPNHHRFISSLAPEDVRFRFFGQMNSLPHSEMARLTQIDYDREMAFIAESITDAEAIATLGVVRAISDSNNEEAEFAIVIRSDLKGTGLGRILMEKIINYCKHRGIKTIVGQVLADNSRMLSFVQNLGFKRTGKIEDDVIGLALDLTEL